nr:hypothetical protein [Tanacetum cinerariifolium]
MDRAATTTSSLELEQDSGIINRTQSTIIPNEPIPQGTGSGGRPSINLTAVEPVTTVSAPITTTGVSISTTKPSTPPPITTTLIEDEVLTIAQTLIKTRSVKSIEKSKEKGELKKLLKVKGKDQIALDEEVAQRLEAQMQAEFKEEERV